MLHVAKCPAVRRFSTISAKSLQNLLLELPSDQENKNGFAAERLWFFGHRVESTLKKFVKHCVTHWHVFMQAKYP